MVDDNFESDLAGLFDQASPFDDEAVFADAVHVRVARIRRAGRVVHTVAAVLGGSIAVLELSQPSLWAWVGQWVDRTGAAASAALNGPAPAWLSPTPMYCAAILGGAVLIAYLANLWREA
jgi:hypothetical protein